MPITPPAIEINVPATYKEQSQISNGIMVEGGTNVDLSRTAVPTPISPYVPVNQGLSSGIPAAVDTPVESPIASIFRLNNIPDKNPSVSIEFKANSYKLSKKDKQLILKNVKKSDTVYVLGFANASEPSKVKITDLRAKEVTSFLKANKIKVVKAYNMAEVPGTFSSEVSVISK